MVSAAPAVGLVEARIRSLSTELFDGSDLAATALTPSLKAKSAAFLLLAHAEIEYALERECHRTAGLLRSAADPATALLAWGFAALRSDGGATLPKKNTPIGVLVEAYERLVEANHGIREHNLTTLLVPLGLDMKSVNTDVLALDDFGRRRGDLAHQPLSNWPTTDLPSTHVRSAVQSGQAADRLAAAIQAGHSTITAITSRRRAIAVRRRVAVLLRRTAALVDSD